MGAMRANQVEAKDINQAVCEGGNGAGSASLTQLRAMAGHNGSVTPPSHASVRESDGREPAHLHQAGPGTGDLAVGTDPNLATARGGDSGETSTAPDVAKRREKDLKRLLQGLKYEWDKGCADVKVTRVPILLPELKSRGACMHVS